jgi:acetyl esterase/lipase
MSYNFDPEFHELLALLPPLDLSHRDKLDAARATMNEMTAALAADLDTSGVSWEDKAIPGPEGDPDVPIRIYRSEAATGVNAGLFYIHGGGFIVGDVESSHGQCVAVCRGLGITVVSVDYRLAPETAFPGPLEDCYAALAWTSDNAASLNIDAARLGIMGVSAGGGLSAATALLARDRGGPALCFQYLGIPELDDRLDTVSMREFTDTPLWNRPNALVSWDCYLGERYQRGAEDVPGYAAPARMEDLSGLPPAYVSTMEFDPLRDEGILYALRLLQAGVRTELHTFPGTFHGSSLFADVPVSQRENEELFAVLHRGLNVS